MYNSGHFIRGPRIKAWHWDPARRSASPDPPRHIGARELWKLGWGLLFVLAMTLLAECGPRVRYDGIPARGLHSTSTPQTPAVK